MHHTCQPHLQTPLISYQLRMRSKTCPSSDASACLIVNRSSMISQKHTTKLTKSLQSEGETGSRKPQWIPLPGILRGQSLCDPKPPRLPITSPNRYYQRTPRKPWIQHSAAARTCERMYPLPLQSQKHHKLHTVVRTITNYPIPPL